MIQYLQSLFYNQFLHWMHAHFNVSVVSYCTVQYQHVWSKVPSLYQKHIQKAILLPCVVWRCIQNIAQKRWIITPIILAHMVVCTLICYYYHGLTEKGMWGSSIITCEVIDIVSFLGRLISCHNMSSMFSKSQLICRQMINHWSDWNSDFLTSVLLSVGIHDLPFEWKGQ